ncbi:MAG: penicillin-binding protein 2 [Desulfocapsaceae bacterium]|nr:penicillin-binding protein 2 [Desulfocapsaceae bacterium]
MARKIFEEIEEIPERDDDALDVLKRRLVVVSVIVMIFTALIIARLWYLQIDHGDDYKDLAFNNRVRIRQVAAPRGHILDRNGKEIVTNRPSFNVVLVREDSQNLEDVLKRLAGVLHEDTSELWKRIRDASGTAPHIPIVLKEDISWDTLAYLENHNQDFSGIRIAVVPVRIYHYGDLASHLIGYLGIINKKELAEADPEKYTGEDLIGKMGLEKLRENDLRGQKGSSSSEVNARGFEQKLLKNEEPTPGKEIRLTLDVDLQQVAESMMDQEDRAGAVVATEVNTGRVLVAASAPKIHLDDFTGGISTENWNALLANPKHPLINKVVQGQYPPGSTYKIVTALAALATGTVTESTIFNCPGHFQFGNRVYMCWRHSGHGAVDIRRAITESCDVYFYQAGIKMGVDTLADFARKLGLGQKTGIEMEHEKSGLIPTREWKLKQYKQKWQDGETVSVAIGQGYDLATPLQINMMTATVANGGKVFLPQIVEAVHESDGRSTDQFHPKLIRELTGMGKYMAIVREGLVGVVNGDRGTARAARIDGIAVAGKTGSAQVVKLAQYKGMKEEDIPYKYRDHAWFTCYAPADDPEIAVTVLVEHGLHGGSEAAPIAKAILMKYFETRLQAMAKEKEDRKNAKPAAPVTPGTAARP